MRLPSSTAWPGWFIFLIPGAALGGAPPASAGAGTVGRLVLSSGESIPGDIAKEFEDLYVLRTPDGLRVVERKLVARVEGAAPRAAGKETAKAAAKAAPSTPQQPPPQAAPKEEPKDLAKEAPEAVPDDVIFKEWDDPRIEDARSGGKPPAVEIIFSGKIDGKAVGSVEGVWIPRLTFFLTEESRPKFEVLPPQPGGAPQTGGEKKARAAEKKTGAEYIARINAETSFEDITFYGESLLKTARTKIRFVLERAGDGKLIVDVEAVEDERADPERREESCRAAFGKGAETLAGYLKKLRTFGGS